MLAQILQPVNEGVGDRQTAVFTFKQYIQDAFLPVYRQKWKESTRSTSEPDIVRYLIPAFGDQLLSAISRNDMQRFLNQKAVSLSSSIVGHLRWHLNAIFKMAAGDGIVEFNPAQALFIPACKAAPTKRAMSKDEVRTALSVLDVRERLVFRMAVFDGMRPGEIFAIQFGKIRENSVFIDQRLYGSSNIDTPKGRKGKNTTRTVGLAPGTIEDLNIWKTFIGEHQGAMYLFSSETRVTPLRPNNHWKRNIRPRLEQFGLGWVNFQVLRRTNASLARKAKVDDKVSADQRGHGLGVSLSVYAISDLDQKIEAVTKLNPRSSTQKKTMISNSWRRAKGTLKRAQKRKRSKRSRGVKLKFLQVVETMERETRIELATNSLEGCDSTIELLPRIDQHNTRYSRKLLPAEPLCSS
jgi:integrase